MEIIINYKLKLLIILALTFLISFCVFGQNQKIEFFVDHAQFRLQQNYVYLEIYYSITRKNLSFKQADDGYHALGKIKTYLKKGDMSLLVDSLLIQDFVKSIDQISPTQRFAEVSAIQVEEGNYVLTSQFTDLVSNQTVDFSDSLKITSFAENQLEISDIELANSISQQNERELKFDKNGLRVVPNASKTYGPGLNKLYFYAEAYNFNVAGKAAGSSYHVDYLIINEKEAKIQEVTGQPKMKPGSSSIINGALDVGYLPSGVYSFKIVVTDDFATQTAASEKNFYIYKIEDFISTPIVKQDQKLTQKDKFETMPEDSLNLHFEMTQYILSREDKAIFKKLDVNGKRNFLRNFWRENDPDPSTPINERKVQYYQLLDYADKNFSMSKKQGWKTDRARVMLIYGQPDEVERHPSSPGQKDYQIWYYYEIEGGIQFVFVDIRSVRNFELVHSTQRNEVHDYDWRERYLKY